MYSRQAWEEGNGFIGAQCVLHLLECALGVVYLWLCFGGGERGDGSDGLRWKLRGEVVGRRALGAVLVGFAGGVAMGVTVGFCCETSFVLNAA